MALVVADRVQETTTTSGTGTFNLAGAVAGFKTFVSGIGTTNTTYYAAYDQTAQVWEVGLGTVTSGSPATLSRDTILSNSSGTTAKISFAGNTTYVWCDYPASKGLYLDASNQLNLTNASGYNIYASGAASNYFAGKVGIGAVPITAATMNIASNMTGATVVYGLTNYGVAQSDVTANAVYFDANPSTAATSFTLTAVSGYRCAQGTFGAGSTVTNQYGFNANNTLTGATNNYGFYSNIASGSNRWNFYAAGTASNYFAGSVGIGSTASAGLSVLIGKTITGAVSCYGLLSNGTIQSDVTNTGQYFRTTVTTANANFALSDIRHYATGQGTLSNVSAGGSVTNQYGFLADASLTGATINYGFYGNIASGANRFNFYAAGTAANYFAGDLTIYGGTAVPAGGTAGTGYKFSSTANLGVFFGSGVPTLSAAQGSLYIRTDGSSTSTRLYVNTNGSTTWTNVTTAA